MLQDLKDRITNRSNLLKAALRKCEDKELTINIQNQSYIKQIEDSKLKLDNLNSSENLKQIISTLEAEVLDCTININTFNDNLMRALEEEKSANSIYSTKLQESTDEANRVKNKWEIQIRDLRADWEIKTQEIKDKLNQEKINIKDKWDAQIVEYKLECTTIEAELKSKSSELIKLKNIVDICPTCGQKLKGIEKPDTSILEKEIEERETKLIKAKANIKTCQESFLEEDTAVVTIYNNNLQDLNNKYQSKLNELQAQYNLELDAGKSKYKNELDILFNNIKSANLNVSSAQEGINIYTNKKLGYETRLSSAKTELASLEATRIAAEDIIKTAEIEIEKLKKDSIDNETEKQSVSTHLNIINKMSTIITRDFRGYLLKNIIEFINKKSKEYALEIFETDKIDFMLNSNNISITYDNKDYESLSGGERQKIDLIVQFAIRDMLCKYLNFSSNILALDEITDNIDSLGAEKLFNMISKKLSDVQSIFIITHHASDLQVPSDHILTVIKDTNKISRVEYGNI